MIVSCPACATRFSLDASLLGPNGRNVRCAKCGHRWRQESATPAPAESPPTPFESAPAESNPTFAPERLGEMAPGLAKLLSGHERQDAIPAGLATPVPPKLRPEPPSRRGGMLPFVLLAGIVVGLLAAAYIFRGPISRVVPGTERIYAILGLASADPARDLQIGNLKFERRGSALLSIRGDIFNPTEFPLKVPPVWVVASDADGKTLQPSLMFRTQESNIAPGETITFRTLYENAPASTKSFRVTFGQLNVKEP